MANSQIVDTATAAPQNLGGSIGFKVPDLLGQPAVRKAIPAFVGLAGLGLAGLAWSFLAQGPQRTLYSALGDEERAAVASALETSGLDYEIDPSSGAITVAEDDFHRARMLVASNKTLAPPETGADLINSLPMGASRTLEGDRLRVAKERELTLTIAEIDGVESVRVHLGQAEKSVFVREKLPPSASVMVRMARGRSLSAEKVQAIANLVAGSVPGMRTEAVKIVDQNGELLSRLQDKTGESVDLQARHEEKIRMQLVQLLTPMLGAGNFSTEAQVELELAEVTSAREQYQPDGALISETQQQRQVASSPARGVPGVLSNTPPAETEAEEGAPEGGAVSPVNDTVGETSSSRQFRVGREVSVSSNGPGSIKRLSVAVAVASEAMAEASDDDLAKLEGLIAAAVGANADRGDTVAVIVRPFEPVITEEIPLWEQSWFLSVARLAIAFLGVVLVIFLVIRPAMKMTARKLAPADREGNDPEQGRVQGEEIVLEAQPRDGDQSQLSDQINLAQRIARENPDDALVALRRMLIAPPSEQGIA